MPRGSRLRLAPQPRGILITLRLPGVSPRSVPLIGAVARLGGGCRAVLRPRLRLTRACMARGAPRPPPRPRCSLCSHPRRVAGASAERCCPYRAPFLSAGAFGALRGAAWLTPRPFFGAAKITPLSLRDFAAPCPSRALFRGLGGSAGCVWRKRLASLAVRARRYPCAPLPAFSRPRPRFSPECSRVPRRTPSRVSQRNRCTATLPHPATAEVAFVGIPPHDGVRRAMRKQLLIPVGGFAPPNPAVASTARDGAGVFHRYGYGFPRFRVSACNHMPTKTMTMIAMISCISIPIERQIRRFIW